MSDLFRDVFAEKQVEEQLIQRRKQLDKLNEVQGSQNAALNEQAARNQQALDELNRRMNNLPVTEEKTATSTSDNGEKIPEVKEEAQEPEKDPMEQLNELVGLDNVKEDVKTIINIVKENNARKKYGKKPTPVTLHLVFSGNPGTGKTTVARILAKLYKKVGVLSQGQLVEVDRSALVAGFVGQTANKTLEKINEAKGGVLFIDEAYTLAKGGNDYGQEAIDTLLKAMEDNRDDLVVIVAGYTDRMKEFIESNPGLKSRFNKYIEFNDYTEEQLFQIFCGICKDNEYIIDNDETYEEIKDEIRKLIQYKDENFANAREVRNMFEKARDRHSNRLAKEENYDENNLFLLTAEDIDVHNDTASSNKSLEKDSKVYKKS